MSTKKDIIVIPDERIERNIFIIRGKKVMMDSALAELYGVETKVLNQAVKRNIRRFPKDFMFGLLRQESEILRSQFVTSSKDHGGRRYFPFVFTEQGVAMLSSVLNSERAIQVNIQIMRTFTKLRELIATNKEVREKIERLEKKYDKNFRIIFEVISRLLNEKESEPTRQIGFNRNKLWQRQK